MLAKTHNRCLNILWAGITSLLAFTAPNACAQDVLRPQTPGGPPFGMNGTPGKHGPALLPQDDDWTYLKQDKSTLRHIGLGKRGDLTVSFGAKAFIELESFRNENFGSNAGTNDFVDLRANLYAGVGYKDRFRIYSAVKYGNREGSDSFVSPVDDDLDLHIAFVEAAIGDVISDANKEDLLFRVGRMELHYGNGRMISMREGPALRNDFDGIVVRYRRNKTVIDTFAVYEVQNSPGQFDNSTITNEGLWGAYANHSLGGGLSLDSYYIGQRRVNATTNSGVADERRHSLGLRYSATPQDSGWSYDIEGTYQFGTASTHDKKLDISAISISGEVSYHFQGHAWSPVAIITFGYTSGDDNPLDERLTTFKVPQPSGLHFGDTNPLGPGNLAGFSAGIDFSPYDNLTVSPGLLAFWRANNSDGIYNPPGRLIRSAGGEGNFIGWEAGLGASYEINSEVTIGGEVAFFDTGAALITTPPDKTIFRFKTRIAYRF